MYFRQRGLRIIFAIALAATAGCTSKTHQLDPEPSWFRAEHREPSVGSRFVGYGSGPNVETARAVALDQIIRERGSVTASSALKVQERAGEVNGENISELYAEQNLTSYVREQTLQGVKAYRGPTIIGTMNYIALIFNDEPMSQIIEKRIEPRCQTRTRSPHSSPSSTTLRKSVKFARELERKTNCRDYDLVYNENLWQVVVGGERETLSPETLRDYFFPRGSTSAIKIHDANDGKVRSSLLKDGTHFTVRFRGSRGSRRHTHWLSIDALGRVLSLDDLVVQENGKIIGVGTKDDPLQAHLNDPNVTRATEYILRLECDVRLRANIIEVGEDIPPVEHAGYYKLGDLLSEATDSCRWDGIDLTIFSVG